MVFVQKLPTLEPEMRGALRAHIIRRRQRLKQEQEQDAIEKRLKKERELRQIQDAMTLDQIKEQLTTLERRLESLREEKHHLFVQLKQVLNDDDSRRKQESTQDKKESDENSLASPTNGQSNEPIKKPIDGPQSQIKNMPHGVTHDATMQPAPRAHDLSSPISRPIPVITAAIPNVVPANLSRRPILAHSNTMAAPMLPPPHHHPLYPANTSSLNQLSTIKPGINTTTFINPEPNPRNKLQIPSRIPDFKESSNMPINFEQHAMQSQLDARRLGPMDVPISLKTSQPDINLLNFSPSGVNSSKRTLASASLPGEMHLTDRMFARKKPNNFIFPSSNQFFMNGLPGELMPNFSQYNSLGPGLNVPGPSVGAPSLQVPSSLPNSIGHDHLAIKPMSLPQQIHPQSSNHPLGPNFDLLMLNQSKPGLLLPGMNPFYNQGEPSFSLHPNQLNPHLNPELRNFSSPFPPIGNQPFSNNPRFMNSPLGPPPDHHSNRYPFPPNFSYGPRGSIQPKNLYHPK